MCLQYKSFENTEGKGEIACNEQFLLFPQCFLPIWRTFCHFHQIWNCHLQSLWVWKSLKFIVWERVKRNSWLEKSSRMAGYQTKHQYLSTCCVYCLVFGSNPTIWESVNKNKHSPNLIKSTFLKDHILTHTKQPHEGYDGPVSIHWLIRKIPSYQTLQYLGTGLKHYTP